MRMKNRRLQKMLYLPKALDKSVLFDDELDNVQ